MAGSFLPKKRATPLEGVSAVSLEGKLSRAYEALLTHIVATTWPDGSERQGSSLTLFVDEGALKACLNDKGNDLVAFVSAESLEGLLGALEAGLREDKLDWRPSRASGAARKRRGS